MKKTKLYRFIAAFFVAAVIVAACTKEEEDVKLDPKLVTTMYSDLKSDSVNVVGFVVAGTSTFTERGVCVSTAPNPTVDNKIVYTGTTSTAAFTVKLKVTRLTKYYVRAYGINSSGVMYGEEFSFTTPAALPIMNNIAVPVVENTAKDGITATTAINITDDGGPHKTADIKSRGVVYGLIPNPSLDSVKSKLEINRTYVTTEGTGKGEFTSIISKLKGKAKYYLRAYATNSIGTRYTNEVSFTTPLGYPLLSTTSVSSLTDVSAKTGGNISNDGGAVITERGVVYGTTSMPTIENGTVIVDAKDTIGSFTTSITGLTRGTKYYARAYASNGTYINYGDEINFTPMFPSTLYMIGDGVGSWDWSETDLPMIPVHSHDNLFWKIVWMKGGETSFKFAPGKEWVNDFGKTGTATSDGIYSRGGENIPVPAAPGYYMVVVDLAAGKISVTDPKVYLIGNTVGSWDTANPSALFTVDNANSVVTVTRNLAADEIRMYAWHAWFTDWWQSEFIILNNKIEFRGKGNDQTRVSVTAGTKTVNLNFKTGAGSIQ
ncbi:MAG TPA: SusF/SusE family outer membrane protein [Bacteroidales bacterium]|nr:SusF/SusE family outer membrane protein [Bacteroidales bacterium]